MLDFSNTAPRSGRPSHPATLASSGHGFSRAVQTRPGEPFPFARLSNSRCPRHASAKHSSLIVNGNQTPKLEQSLTCTKHSTSQFLIDNFERLHGEVVDPTRPEFRRTAKPRRLQAYCHCSCFSLVAGHCSPPFLIANDLHSREKPCASQQSTYEFLIANEFHSSEIGKSAFFPISLLPCRTASLPASSRSRLSTFNCQRSSLIENDMHSRKESSCCKQGTYEILIENEIQSLLTANFPNLDWNCACDSVESRARYGAKARPEISRRKESDHAC